MNTGLYEFSSGFVSNLYGFVGGRNLAQIHVLIFMWTGRFRLNGKSIRTNVRPVPCTRCLGVNKDYPVVTIFAPISEDAEV